MSVHQIASTGQFIEDNHQPSSKPATARQSMHIKVYSPFHVYFDEEADSISAVNATGPFDILPSHHSFMTLLDEGDLLIRQAKAQRRIWISHGIMHVKADRVVVFLDV